MLRKKLQGNICENIIELNDNKKSAYQILWSSLKEMSKSQRCKIINELEINELDILFYLCNEFKERKNKEQNSVK